MRRLMLSSIRQFAIKELEPSLLIKQARRPKSRREIAAHAAGGLSRRSEAHHSKMAGRQPMVKNCNVSAGVHYGACTFDGGIGRSLRFGSAVTELGRNAMFITQWEMLFGQKQCPQIAENKHDGVDGMEPIDPLALLRNRKATRQRPRLDSQETVTGSESGDVLRVVSHAFGLRD